MVAKGHHYRAAVRAREVNFGNPLPCTRVNKGFLRRYNTVMDAKSVQEVFEALGRHRRGVDAASSMKEHRIQLDIKVGPEPTGSLPSGRYVLVLGPAAPTQPRKPAT